MDIDDARQFLAANHRAVLATIRADGRPQLSPVGVGVDGEGRAVISIRETAYKVRNLRRQPWASLCV
ncbi:MAG: pyridoxamine 5'-phosphate oxidase family protein, partial [Acidimicrobiales bacterium]